MKKNLNSWIEGLIQEFVLNDPGNSLHLGHGEKAWDAPIVGFASAADPLFLFLKRDIGDFYWLPNDIFPQTFPSEKCNSHDLSVISWVLPQSEQIKKDHRDEGQYPSERWSRSKLYGESFNDKLRDYVVKQLSNAGFPALAPMRLSEWKREDSQKYGYASSWSERHTAYVCGLGTFGLSDGLITSVGKAVRFGSVIAKIQLKPTERQYKTHNAYCLFHKNGKCRKCRERCPADAITERGHDKVKCRSYIREITTAYVKQIQNLDVYSCGLCQVGVPCESKIPIKTTSGHKN